MTPLKLKLLSSLSIITLFLVGIFSTRPIQAVVAHVSHLDRNYLLETIGEREMLDAAQFWEWRDKTYGTFIFDPLTTTAGMNRRISKPTTSLWKLHTFSSLAIQSSEDSLYYTTAPVSQLMSELSNECIGDNCTKLKQGADFIIWQENNSAKMYLVFLKDASELQKVDGLFDFVGQEPTYLEQAYWLNKTVLN